MLSLLAQEHALLGASFNGGLVEAYLNETPLAEALEGSCLFDLSGELVKFVSGQDASRFCEALCSGKRLVPGSCAFTGVLTGDGALVSVPLLVRGGEHEYMILDASARNEILQGWMAFAKDIEKDGVKAYESLAVDDAAGMLVPLLVCGKRCRELLSDYTAANGLPKAGFVGSVPLDGVPCVIAHLATEIDAFVVFAPPVFAPRLFRSFLSFQYVHPKSHPALLELMERLPWSSALAESDRVVLERATLADWGLVRPDADYIGARGV